MTNAEHRADHLNGWHLCVAALRERGVRSGAIKPANDDERRQATEGPRPTAEYDCVREQK